MEKHRKSYMDKRQKHHRSERRTRLIKKRWEQEGKK